jgi:hypothetical protein
MRQAAAVIILAIGLTACTDARTSEVARCRFEVMKAFKEFDNSNAQRNFMVTCMQTAGYELRWGDDTCASNLNLHYEPSCYRTATWLGRLLDDLASGRKK